MHSLFIPEISKIFAKQCHFIFELRIYIDDSSEKNHRKQVQITDGQIVGARLSGLLRMNFIRIMPGDRVRVEYSTDTMKGRITYPYRNK